MVCNWDASIIVNSLFYNQWCEVYLKLLLSYYTYTYILESFVNSYLYY